MPDYMFLLESRLSPEQRAVMMRVQELAAAMGFNLYLTGGTVRDLITGRVAARSGFYGGRKSFEDGARIGKGRREDSRARTRSCGTSKSCSRATWKAVFPRRATITMCGRGRGRRSGGRRSWRICGGGIFR